MKRFVFAMKKSEKKLFKLGNSGNSYKLSKNIEHTF